MPKEKAVKTELLTEKEILSYIRSDERRLERLKDEITVIRCDMRATRKSLKFWQNELKKVQKRTTNKKG